MKKILKLKSLIYLLKQGPLFKAFLKRPFFYLKRYFFQKEKTSSAFFHGVQSLGELQALVKNPNNLLLLGFSYCQKPLFCPSGRFNADCSFDPALCSNCFIGKCFQKELINSEKMIITTASSLAEKLLFLASSESSSSRQIVFVICACAFSIRIFEDFPDLLNLSGRSFPLSGAVCTSFKEFKRAENGQKKGAMSLCDTAQRAILELVTVRSNKRG